MELRRNEDGTWPATMIIKGWMIAILIGLAVLGCWLALLFGAAAWQRSIDRPYERAHPGVSWCFDDAQNTEVPC